MKFPQFFQNRWQKSKTKPQPDATKANQKNATTRISKGFSKEELAFLFI